MLNSRWQTIRKLLVVVGIIAVLVVVITLIIVVVLGYWLNWPWVGVSGGNSKITTTTTATEQPPAKTLWDWMQLLFVPAVLAFGGLWFTAQQGEVSARDNKDSQREAALQEYITKMSELLLEKNLRGSAKNEEVRKIARVRTLTILGRLDGDRMRKRSVLLFLHEAGLVGTYSEQEGILEPIIDLWDADFSQADLSRAHLFGVSLIKANLRGADLSCTFLEKANFHWAVLSEANLSNDNRCADYRDEKPNLKEVDFSKAYLDKAKLINTDLSGANLTGAIGYTTEQLEKQAKSLKGAIMPDGKMYPNSSGANLSEANLSEANLSGVDLSGAVLSEADLSGANLLGANLTGADLSGADLKGITGITIEELEKQAKSLKGATMPDGKMYRNSSGAKLAGVDLRTADLSGVDLSRANLTSANLYGANLSNTDLSGANLTGAIGYTTEQLEKQAKSLKGAIMPDGKIHP